jgi:predicted DNA-binding transcriptional regulator AlpA
MLRLPQVLARVGGSKTWWYDLIERGAAPAPIRYSPRHVVWPETVITAWQRQQIRTAQRKG